MNSTLVNRDSLNANEIINIMNYLNAFRIEFGSPELKYSEVLSNMAKPIAINYLKHNIYNNLLMNDSNITDTISRNLLFLKNVRNNKLQNIKNIISKWYNEKKYYDFDDESNIKYKSCQNFINLIFESNIECGFWYSYSNGKCVLCMYFKE